MKFQLFINRFWLVLAMILLVGLSFNVLLQTAWAAGPIYVDADAPGPTSNGLSWTTAYTNVQDALAAATTGSEMWVAAGVYTPTHKTNPGDPRTATFQLQNAVSLYGGFAGTEINRSQRNWTTNVTVLSGDLDGNDTTTPNGVVTDTNNIIGANAYHVVTSNSVTQTAVLDGFTITAGRADDESWETDDDRVGGGMYNEGSPALINVIFSGNSAFSGGGMRNNGGNPTLTNVTFSGNSAIVGSGGGMSSGGNPTLTNVTFSGNSAFINGGGMASGGNPMLTNVTFSGNSTMFGGGMSSGGNPTLINIIFNGNSALYGGGGMHSSGNPTLTNVIFSGNFNSEGGGGMENYGGSPTLTNVTFSGNSVDNWGGGGMYNSDGSSPTLSNCILWGNTTTTGDNQIENVDGSTPTISYSLVQGSGGSSSWDTNLGTDGGSNIDADPLFVDADGLDNIVGTPDDNLRLQATSPAIDAGNNDALPTDTSDLDNDGNTIEKIPFDVNGYPRLVDNIGNGYIVDMGACEAQGGMPSPDIGSIYLPIVSKNN